jgi:glycosyltransferase involved in cell wall biosynthesis
MRGPQKRIDYLCLQATFQGQASYVHVREIVGGLRRRGWWVELVEVAHPRPGRFASGRRFFGLGAIQLRYAAKRLVRPAKLVYVRAHFAALPTALLCHALGSRVVQEVNGPVDDVYDAWPWLRRFHVLVSWSARAQLRLADAVVTVTPGLQDYVASMGAERTRCTVIGNGADIELFHPNPERDSSGRAYAVFVGALASWQGIQTVLDAAASPEWPTGVDLVIAGDGRERSHVISSTLERSHIRWLGAIPYRDTPALVSNSLAALIPMVAVARSKYGLAPLKLFEAMASGVPVVASELPGLAEVVSQFDCGVLVPPGDPDALARAVGLIASDSGRRTQMGLNGRAAAVAEFSWAARVEDTEKLLEGLLQANFVAP